MTEEEQVQHMWAARIESTEPVEERERWYCATSCADPDCEICAYRRKYTYNLPPLTDEQKAAMREGQGDG